MNKTDEELEIIGNYIIHLFNLKENTNGYYNTDYGEKSIRGLALTIIDYIENG